MPDNGWHLDKRVPIALIATIVIQSAGAVWWAATVNASLTQISERQDRFEQFISEGARFTQRDAERRINPLEQSMAVIQSDLRTIRTLLEELRRESRNQ